MMAPPEAAARRAFVGYAVDMRRRMCSEYVWAGSCLLAAAAAAGQPAAKQDQKKPAAAADDPSAKTPTKTLEENGILISPAIAKKLREALQRGLKGADKHEVLFGGPGMASAESSKLIPKPPEGWVFKAAPGSVCGAELNGLDMMVKLPDVLAKARPGYVVLVGSLSRGKGDATEVQDWQDACAQCLRYGAIPVLGIPDAKDNDAPGRWLFRSAATSGNLPAFDLLNAGGAERVSILVKLLDDVVGAGAGGKGADVPVDE